MRVERGEMATSKGQVPVADRRREVKARVSQDCQRCRKEGVIYFRK